MLANPERSVAEIVGFLETLGVDVAAEASDPAVKSLDATLQHQKAETDVYSEMARVQEEMFLDVSQHTGIHDKWEAMTSLPTPPLWVDDAIRLRRDLANKRRELRLLQKSWPNRVANAAKTFKGRSTQDSESND